MVSMRIMTNDQISVDAKVTETEHMTLLLALQKEIVEM